MDTFDEIPLEDHRFFATRLAYLETHQPKTLLDLLENGSLTAHLRETTSRAMKALGESMLNNQIPADQAEEIVMSQIVTEPREAAERLSNPQSRRKLHRLIREYRKGIQNLPRTYQSHLETIE